MYKAARWSWRPWKNTLIRLFIDRYEVDLGLAARAAPDEFRSFNDFFTRGLKAGVRPIAAIDGGLTSPVDASINAVGTIENDRIFQAKGKKYSLEALLNGDREAIGYYRNGHFITLYLSPKDYHRVHMPVDGELQSMVYIPGRLFSVSEATTNAVARVFARNERVITTFRSRIGLFSVIFIGAMLVGSMETAWHGQITPCTGRKTRRWRYGVASDRVNYLRGEEIGRFNMGSTVIVLTGQNRIKWERDCIAGKWVAMGQQIATGI